MDYTIDWRWLRERIRYLEHELTTDLSESWRKDMEEELEHLRREYDNGVAA